jgi:arginase family enzyme
MTTTFNGALFLPEQRVGDPKRAVGVLGAPYDLGSTTRATGQAQAPLGIRLSYRGPDLGPQVVELGDIGLDGMERSNATVADRVAAEVAAAMSTDVHNLIVLGGDDSISYGVVCGFDKPYVMHWDAHDDWDDDYHVLDHSNWARKAWEEDRMGIYSSHYVRVPGCKEQRQGYIHNSGKVFVLDMDVFDPSDAPGVAVPEPFGQPARRLMRELRQAWRDHDTNCLVITEVVPALDHNEQAQRLAFRIAYDFAQWRSVEPLPRMP